MFAGWYNTSFRGFWVLIAWVLGCFDGFCFVGIGDFGGLLFGFLVLRGVVFGLFGFDDFDF